jgi:hypothetical protein
LPRPWLISRMPCADCPRVARAREEPGGPPTCLVRLSTPTTRCVDPGSASGSSPKRALGGGVGGVNTIAIGLLRAHGAVSSCRACGLPGGLRGALGPLRRCRAALRCRLPRGNTRYEWLVRPSSAGTCPLPEAPSFAWRTNAKAQPLSEVGATQERTLETVGCSAWLAAPAEGVPTPLL